MVTPNAKAGVHAEHSWGDAPTLAHILEWCSSSDEVKELFGPDGHAKPQQEDDDAQQEPSVSYVLAPSAFALRLILL